MGRREQARLWSVEKFVHLGAKGQCVSCTHYILTINQLTMSTQFKTAIDPEEWISQAQASRFRGVSRQAIAKLVGSGRLRTLTLGGRTFVSRADILAFEPKPAGRPKGTARE